MLGGTVQKSDPRFYCEPVIIIHEAGDNKGVAGRFLGSVRHGVRELREILRYEATMLPLTPEQQAEYNAEHVIAI